MADPTTTTTTTDPGIITTTPAPTPTPSPTPPTPPQNAVTVFEEIKEALKGPKPTDDERAEKTWFISPADLRAKASNP